MHSTSNALNAPGIVETETSLSCVGRWHCGDPGFAVHPTVNSKLLAEPRQRHDALEALCNYALYINQHLYYIYITYLHLLVLELGVNVLTISFREKTE